MQSEFHTLKPIYSLCLERGRAWNDEQAKGSGDNVNKYSCFLAAFLEFPPGKTHCLATVRMRLELIKSSYEVVKRLSPIDWEDVSCGSNADSDALTRFLSVSTLFVPGNASFSWTNRQNGAIIRFRTNRTALQYAPGVARGSILATRKARKLITVR